MTGDKNPENATKDLGTASDDLHLPPRYLINKDGLSVSGHITLIQEIFVLHLYMMNLYPTLFFSPYRFVSGGSMSKTEPYLNERPRNLQLLGL
jgi:hypothetical protein